MKDRKFFLSIARVRPTGWAKLNPWAWRDARNVRQRLDRKWIPPVEELADGLAELRAQIEAVSARVEQVKDDTREPVN